MALAGFASVLDATRGIGWPAVRRVRSAVAGSHPSIVRGSSDEFIEYRLYRQGDDPTTIDWRLVARTDRVYVRVSQEHALLPTMVVLDASASMAFPAATLAKWEHARRLALGLASIARHRGDPVGLAVVRGARTTTVEPRARRTVLEEMLRAIEAPPSGSPPLAPVLREAVQRSKRVVVLGDFLGDADAMLAASRAFVAGGGELHAIHVVDPAELDPDPRKLLLADPERPDLRRPMSAAGRAEYLRRFGEWREQLARDWRLAGAHFVTAVPGREPLRATFRRITTPVAATGTGTR